MERQPTDQEDNYISIDEVAVFSALWLVTTLDVSGSQYVEDCHDGEWDKEPNYGNKEVETEGPLIEGLQWGHKETHGLNGIS